MNVKNASPIICMLTVCLLFLSLADVHAMEVWSEGEITKSVWGNTTKRIEIDHHEYRLIANAPVHQIVRHEDKKGFDMEPKTVRSLKVGKKISFKYSGNRVYEIEIHP